ncbi:MAG TPA: hypothetical protein VGP80_14815 [Gemmatimonadales bacterium]|jgi:ABC-type antimicrobial peptide transport system permease subunit|nr:hypothetical protein [Gemmatimonadales bacterium]
MKVLGLALLIALAGYVVGVFLGIGLVKLSSSSRPDKSMEAVMTGFFYVGPAVAVLSFIGALIYLIARKPA